MRVLFDQGTPAPLRTFLVGHEVATAYEIQWRQQSRLLSPLFMPTTVRSTRPICPACGFPVYNRRCAKCEKCQAALPPSVAYTSEEIASMRQKERVEEDERARRSAKARSERAQRTARTRGLGLETGSSPVNLSDVLDASIDLSDILDIGGN